MAKQQTEQTGAALGQERTGKKAQKRWWSRALQFVVGAEQESEEQDGLSPREVLRQINGAWVRRQLGFVAALFLLTMASITCGYITQNLQVRRNALKKELDDYHYRVLTRSSELTRETRQSLIEERLKANGDSTLQATPDAPFVIEKDAQR